MYCVELTDGTRDETTRIVWFLDDTIVSIYEPEYFDHIVKDTMDQLINFYGDSVKDIRLNRDNELRAVELLDEIPTNLSKGEGDRREAELAFTLFVINYDIDD